jgi:hypothetical protein
MKTITLLSTAAAVLTAVAAFAPAANAERICRQVCEQGFCQTQCVENDHIFLDNQDKDFYLRHGSPEDFTDR